MDNVFVKCKITLRNIITYFLTLNSVNAVSNRCLCINTPQFCYLFIYFLFEYTLEKTGTPKVKVLIILTSIIRQNFQEVPKLFFFFFTCCCSSYTFIVLIFTFIFC